MKPEGRIALAKRIGNALAEAQLAALDGLGATAALGAAACSGFEQVGHAVRILRGGTFRRTCPGRAAAAIAMAHTSAGKSGTPAVRRGE